jgi:hypothetical protein
VRHLWIVSGRVRWLITLGLIAAVALCVQDASVAFAVGDADMTSCGAFPATEASAGFRGYLPDCRAYEMVTPPEKNAVQTGLGVPSTSGDGVNWEAIGACCGASSGAANLYQSDRTPAGWQTRALTPTPSQPLTGLSEEQTPVFWTGELSQTIFSSPASYAAGDDRPHGSDAQDLYLEGPTGSLTWLSQGPSGTGTAPDTATFDGSTGDADHVVFSSAEQLTPNATGLASLNTPAQFLYVRDIDEASTSLVDVNNADALLSPYGASLGDGGFLGEDFLSADAVGTTTNAISSDGSKIFFESPPGGTRDLPEGVDPHLYMRNESDDTTTPLDDPSSTGTASYDGASTSGSLAFFTSDEGLDGASPAEELYEFNSTTEQIGAAPPMSVVPVSSGSGVVEPSTTLVAEPEFGFITVASTAGFLAGRPITVEGETEIVKSVVSSSELALVEGFANPHAAGATITQRSDGIIGETAISNDGSHVYFIANEVLAENANPRGQTAAVNEPNLYVYDTTSGQTTFVATVAWTDVSDCEPDCAEATPSALVAEPDIDRPAVPTPNGSALVFASSGDLTGQDTAPATTLTVVAPAGANTITVASTAGFLPGHTVTIDTGGSEELAVIESVDDESDQITLSELGPSGSDGLFREHPSGVPVRLLHTEIYRYAMSEGEVSLVCVSCAPAGVIATGSATLGDTGGGSYAPAGKAVPLSEDGSRIFFDSPDPLVPGAAAAAEVPEGTFGSSVEPTNVYEWENEQVYLISDGSTIGATLDGTTPSGDDVFFTTRARLVPQDTDEYEDIYDARVGGGFPASPVPAAPCEGQDCRPQSEGAAFFSLPATATLGGTDETSARSTGTPTFAVSEVTAEQRAKLARTGSLRLIVTVTGASTISASVSATLRGRSQRVARASVTLPEAGRTTLTLRLNSTARAALAKSRNLRLRLMLTDSAGDPTEVAELRLHA